MSKSVYSQIAALKAKHKKTRTPKFKHEFPKLKADNEGVVLSNKIEGKGGFKRNKLTDHRWRKEVEETSVTVSAMQEKTKRIRPHFNKGGYMYSTDGDNEGEIRIYIK